MTPEINRRGFLKVPVATVGMLSLTGGTSLAQLSDAGFDDAAFLIGPRANLPGAGFFDNKTNYHYIYWVTDDSGRYEVEYPETEWSLIPGTRSRLFDSLTEDQTVTNTTTRTTVFESTIQADHFTVGDVYSLLISGSYTTTNSTEQFTLRFHLGDTILAAITSVQANVSEQPWYAELNVTVRSIGSNGVLKPHVVAAFDNTHDDQHSGGVTLDTTIAETLSVTVEWDEANVGNEVLVGQASLKRVGTP